MSLDLLSSTLVPARHYSAYEPMNSTTVALTSLACIFGSTIVGVSVRRFLPEHHLSSESKEAVKLGAGMISMMSALVLGLLVSSAKNNFDSTTAAITQSGARVIVLDRLLMQYGPETQELRVHLRQNLAATIELLWPEEGPTESALNQYERAKALDRLLVKLRELHPQSDAQRAIQSQALQLSNEMLMTRWVQIEQAQTTLPGVFVVILLFWLTMLYLCFGLLAPRNATVITAMLIATVAVATAMFLIFEMSRPMAGIIKVPSGPMRKALEVISRDAGPQNRGAPTNAPVQIPLNR